MQGAAKVGFLVIAFVVLVYGAYSFLGRSLLKPPTNDYYADFSDAGGIVEGTNVLMAGVKIGRVKKVSLVTPRKARVLFEANSDVRIQKGSTAVIASSLISFGDSGMQIMPPAVASADYFAAGDTLDGVRTGPLDNILPNSKETMAELTKTLAAVRKLVENNKLQDKVATLLTTSNKTLAQFGQLAAQANTMVARSSPSIQHAMADASATMGEIRKGMTMLTKMIQEGKFQDKTLALLDKLNQSAANANKLMGDLSAYVNDPEMKANLKSTSENVAKITDNGTRITESAEKIAKNGEEISKNGITMSEKAIELETKASALLDDVKKAVSNITGFFNKGGGKPSIPKIEGTMDLTRETKPGHWRTDLEGQISLGDENLHLGLFDAFESNKLILQLGKPFGKGNELRYGIYASKPGVGVDYRLAPRLFLRGDLFDINNPRFDLRARYEFGKGVYGWLGFEKILDKNAPSIGIGVRK